MKFFHVGSAALFLSVCACENQVAVKGAVTAKGSPDMPTSAVTNIKEAGEEPEGELGLVAGERALSWSSATHGIAAPGGVAVSSWAPEVFDIFWRGDDCHLKVAWRANGTWGGPQDLGGCIESAPTAVSWAENRIDVFARGAGNNNLWHIWWDGARWSGWENLGGDIRDSPSVASASDGHLDVFARGSDNGLWHRWYTRASWWSGWESLSGSITSSPAAVSWGPGRIDVFVRGYEGGLWQRYFDGAWRPWGRLGSFTINGAPTVASRDVGKLDIFARNAANSLLRLSWTGNSWTSLYSYRGWVSSVAPAAISDKPSETHVFFPVGGSLLEKTARDAAPAAPPPPDLYNLAGHVDSVTLEADGSNTIRGWACQIGYDASIPVHLYAVNPASGGLQIVTAAQADEPSEQGVATQCKTNFFKHRFTARVGAAQAQAASGQLVRVYGIRVAPGSGNANAPISRSDYFVYRGAKYSRVAAKPGLGIHNTVFSSRPTEVEDDMNAIGSLGVKLVRLEMAPNGNPLLVSAMQRAKANNIDVLLIMNLIHGDFYDTPAPGTLGVNRLSAISVAKYKAALQRELTYLKNQGMTPAALEVGNEIDLHYFNGDIPDHDYQNIPSCPKCVVVKDGVTKMFESQNEAFNAMLRRYGEVLRASYEVRNEVFPDMRLVTFGAAGKSALPHIFFRLGGALGENYLSYVDGIGIHDYGYDSAEVSAKFSSINSITQTYFGFTKKFWITEFGFGASWWIPGTNGTTIPQNTDARKNWFRSRIDFYGTTGVVEAMFAHDFRPTTDLGEKYSMCERTNGQYVMYKESQVFLERGP